MWLPGRVVLACCASLHFFLVLCTGLLALADDMVESCHYQRLKAVWSFWGGTLSSATAPQFLLYGFTPGFYLSLVKGLVRGMLLLLTFSWTAVVTLGNGSA